MSESLIVDLAINAVSLISGGFTAAALVRLHEKRLDRLENWRLEMPNQYISRAEFYEIVAGLRRQIEHRPISALDASVDLYELYRPIAKRFEADIDHLYLDTRSLATVGMGFRVFSLEDSCRMPWRRGDGSLANSDEIRADYLRVVKMRGGLRAAAYACPGALTLNDADRDTIFRARAAGCVAGLEHIFPNWSTLPINWKLALLDLVWNLGLGIPESATQPATGFFEYRRLIHAVRSGDGKTAAECCGRDVSDPSFASRNAWTRAQFLSEAHDDHNS
jgi:hypothetical protein